jgi:hypothetical protein
MEPTSKWTDTPNETGEPRWEPGVRRVSQAGELLALSPAPAGACPNPTVVASGPRAGSMNGELTDRIPVLTPRLAKSR